MSRNNQIEEMAMDICKSRIGKLSEPCRRCSGHEQCLYQDIACALYNAGYRKQSEVEKTVLSKAASKFAGHSDYHGDTILQVLYCMAEGKEEVNDAKPLEHEARSEGEWISVDERLPDTQEEVLTYSECNGVRGACLLVDTDGVRTWFLYATEKLSISITHWMTFPEAPKMKGGAE